MEAEAAKRGTETGASQTAAEALRVSPETADKLVKESAAGKSEVFAGIGQPGT